ncbi:MAG TPA: IS66 family transposase [Ktedonobacteraceae bacterium]
MTKDEELQALREENRTLKALVAELLPLKEQLAQATARIKELEERLAKDSRTSSKPPSSDGLARLPRRSRRPSGKRPGGQAGHPGHTLLMVEQPDEVVRHRPTVCRQCREDLSYVPGIVAERRQVLDLPEIRLLAHEHQIEAICCPTCHTTSLGNFPTSISAPVQYGPNLQALAVYLHQGQLLPTARTCEALAAMCGCHIWEATLLQWSELAAERLAPTVERIAELIVASRLQHGDETGIRVYGMLHWLHVNCTRFLTHLAWHASRGRQAMDEIGIWPHFTGRGMHDRLVSYDTYDCAHSICSAHLLRECAAVAEPEHQEWATEMQDFLLDLHDACQEWRLLRLSSVPALERDDWVARYFEILAAGYAAQPPPPVSSATKRKGRPKQSQAKNLLDALLLRAEHVLALLDDLRIPFTNHQAERDLRWAKVQQKISGTFRSATGVTAFCRIRSYLSTMHKQGHPMLSALTAVFHGQPLPVAWAPE